MVVDPDFLADPFEGKGTLVVDTPYKRVWVSYEADSDAWHFCTVQPVGAILEANQAKANATAGERWGDMRHVASIPNALYWHGDFAKAVENQDDRWIERFLNDADNRKLRTFEGAL